MDDIRRNIASAHRGKGMIGISLVGADWIIGSFKVVIVDTIIHTINFPIKLFFAQNFD